MPRKNTKTVKGILKRARITKTGKVRFSRTGKQKLNGHESGQKLQDKRGYVMASSHAIPRLRDQLNQRVIAADKQTHSR